MALLNRLSKVGLIVGYLSLFAAVLLVRRAPADGYTLWFYRATPTAFWVGVGVALGVAVVVAFSADRERRTHGAALLLAASAALSVMTIPLLRGFYFYGAGDSLSHLGWAQEIAAGRLLATELLYPGLHVASIFVGRVTGAGIRLGMLYLTLVAFSLVFVLFVPLAVQVLADTTRAFTVGVFAAILFVPINNVALYVVPHPATQGVLFLAVMLYLALVYATYSGGRTDWRPSAASTHRVTGVGTLFALSSVTLVLLHPQQGLNAVFLFGAIAAYQVLARRLDVDRAVAAQRPLIVQAGVLAAAFLLWAPRFERVQGAVVGTILDIARFGPTAGEVVASKTPELVAIGGSVPILFVKLFAGGAVLSAVAAVFIALGVTNRLGDRESNALVRVLAVGLVPLVAIFLVVLASSTGDMYFRYQGVMMAPVTILGAAAIARGLGTLATTDRGEQTGRNRVGRLTVVVLLVSLLPIAVLGMHSSPHMYQPSKQVPEGYVEGYDTAFSYREPGVQWAGLRGGPQRYVDVTHGTHRARTTLEFPGYKYGTVPPGVFAAANYSEAFDDPRYLSLTRRNYEKEVVLYEGIHFPKRGFRALETTPGVNRVSAGGGFALYYVPAGGESTAAAPDRRTGVDVAR